MWSKQLLAGLLVLTSVEAVQYGNNWVSVRKDPPQVEANFPRPNVTLLSPAFTNPGSVPPEFSNGTQGPTSDAILSGQSRR